MDHETITKLAEQEEAGSSGANFLPFLTGKPACLSAALHSALCARALSYLDRAGSLMFNHRGGSQDLLTLPLLQ